MIKSTTIIAAALTLMVCSPAFAKKNEAYYNEAYCSEIGGTTEVKHYFKTAIGQKSTVIVDCETDWLVIEGGLDKRSSLDSLQQAIGFYIHTGKKPQIVIYDTDGQEGRIEYRIRKAVTLLSRYIPIEYISISIDDLGGS